MKVYDLCEYCSHKVLKNGKIYSKQKHDIYYCQKLERDINITEKNRVVKFTGIYNVWACDGENIIYGKIRN